MGVRTKRRLELETEVRTVPLRGSAVGEREDWGKEGNREGLHELELEHVHAQGKDLEDRRAEGVGESEMSIFFPSLSDSGGKTIRGEVEWGKGSWKLLPGRAGPRMRAWTFAGSWDQRTCTKHQATLEDPKPRHLPGSISSSSLGRRARQHGVDGCAARGINDMLPIGVQEKECAQHTSSFQDWTDIFRQSPASISKLLVWGVGHSAASLWEGLTNPTIPINTTDSIPVMSLGRRPPSPGQEPVWGFPDWFHCPCILGSVFWQMLLFLDDLTSVSLLLK